MTSEILLPVMVLLLTLQSTFWCSLFTIPLAILAILATQQVLKLSGMTVFIFCLVFVGGLLLLIVMVSALSHQESSLLASVILTFMVVLPVMFSLKIENIEQMDKMGFMFWFEKAASMLSFPLLSLFISLVLISIFFSNSKVMSRII